MIELQKKCGWDFIFQAANIDVKQEAENLGINAEDAMEFDPTSEGVSKGMKLCCAKISCMRKKKTDKEPTK